MDLIAQCPNVSTLVCGPHNAELSSDNVAVDKIMEVLFQTQFSGPLFNDKLVYFEFDTHGRVGGVVVPLFRAKRRGWGWGLSPSPAPLCSIPLYFVPWQHGIA